MPSTLILLLIFIPAIIVFVVYALSASRVHAGRHPLPLGLLIPLAIVGPMGALCGSLLWGGRRSPIPIIISAIMLAVVPLLIYLL